MIETDFQRREFADGEELAKGLADWTAERLRGAIAARGVALLVVSGGKSPARFFDLLSNLDLDWTRVAITLADERRVADDSPRSNARLARERLLRNRAEAASFTPLADVRLPEDRELAAASARIANLPMPADVVVLGWATMDTRLRGFPAPKGLPKRWTRRLGSSSLRFVRAKRRRTAPYPHWASHLARHSDRARDPGRSEARNFRGRARARPGGGDAHSGGAARRSRSPHCVHVFTNGCPPPVQRPKSVLRLDRRDELKIVPIVRRFGGFFALKKESELSIGMALIASTSLTPSSALLMYGFHEASARMRDVGIIFSGLAA